MIGVLAATVILTSGLNANQTAMETTLPKQDVVAITTSYDRVLSKDRNSRDEAGCKEGRRHHKPIIIEEDFDKADDLIEENIQTEEADIWNDEDWDDECDEYDDEDCSDDWEENPVSLEKGYAIQRPIEIPIPHDRSLDPREEYGFGYYKEDLTPFAPGEGVDEIIIKRISAEIAVFGADNNTEEVE